MRTSTLGDPNAEHLLEEAQARARAYVGAIGRRRVYPDEAALAGLEVFDEPLPDSPTDPLATIRLLDEAGSPATVATTGGRYFGFVIGGAYPVAIAADWLASAWDQAPGAVTVSPATTRIEAVAGKWMTQILGLPPESVTAFVTGASVGNLVGLAAARRHLLLRAGHDVEKDGLFGAPPLRVVVGAEGHSTLFKALAILGLGRQRVELVEADAQGRIRADRLPPLDDRTILCLQAGNVNSGAFDPFADIVPAARAAGAWTHVDGAFGLWAAASPRYAHLLAGVDGADSWVTDGHKWLNVPYDCGMLICRHPATLRGAMAIEAAYLPDEAVAPKDLGPELSRRARAVPVWATLRTLGRQGVAELVDRCCAHARRLAEGLERIGFTIHNHVVLNQIVATIGTDELTDAVRRRVEADGMAWFGPTHWAGRPALRFSVSSWATTDEDIALTLDAVAGAVALLRAEPATAAPVAAD